MNRRRVLVLGGGGGASLPRRSRLGWHQRQLRDAASRHSIELGFADYESLHAQIDGQSTASVTVETDDADVDAVVEAVSKTLDDFDMILTRTMPAGSLEQITFRLAVLHQIQHASGDSNVIANPPASLELAIDKYATLARAAKLDIATPPTIVCQSRQAAINAFDSLGGDVVVKPIFGGEGRGVMRIRDRELAWTTFSTLTQLQSVCYVQQFIPPGGVDIRLLIIGDESWTLRRRNPADFRTNVRGGGTSERVANDEDLTRASKSIMDELGLVYAAVDWIEPDAGRQPMLVEVNAIPGWRGAQSVVKDNLAERIIGLTTRART